MSDLREPWICPLSQSPASESLLSESPSSESLALEISVSGRVPVRVFPTFGKPGFRNPCFRNPWLRNSWFRNPHLQNFSQIQAPLKQTPLRLTPQRIGIQTQSFFWSGYPRLGWGGGLPRRGGGQKVRHVLRNPGKPNFLAGYPRSLWREIPRVPEKFEKKELVFNFRTLFKTSECRHRKIEELRRP